MSGNKGGSLGGVLIIAAGIFGAGWLAAPDAVERTKTEVEIIKVPVSTVVTKTKVKQLPAPTLSPACADLPKKVRQLASINEEMLGAIAAVPDDISDARQGIQRGVVAETTDSLERINQAKAEFAGLYQSYIQAESELKVQEEECKNSN